MKKKKRGPTVNINGPAQLNNNSPGSVQNNNYYGARQRHFSDEAKDQIRRMVPAGLPIMFYTADGDTSDSGQLMYEIQEFVLREGYRWGGAGHIGYAGPPPRGLRLIPPDAPEARGMWTIYIGPP